MTAPKIFTDVGAVTNVDDIVALSCGEALRQSGRNLALFTPALLVTHGGFDRDPVIEFDARFPATSKDLRPFSVDLKKDREHFFVGLGLRALPGRNKPVNWDKRLYAIDASRADECFAFLGGIAFSNQKTAYFASVFSYDIAVPDPTSINGLALTVKIFGVVSSSAVHMLRPAIHGPPQAKTIVLASPENALNFLASQQFLSPFTGTDPLTVRDEP
jgi:hypothetical protein